MDNQVVDNLGRGQAVDSPERSQTVDTEMDALHIQVARFQVDRILGEDGLEEHQVESFLVRHMLAADNLGRHASSLPPAAAEGRGSGAGAKAATWAIASGSGFHSMIHQEIWPCFDFLASVSWPSGGPSFCAA